MSDKFFVLTAKDRRILDGLQRSSDAAPPPAMIPNQDKQYTAAPDVYWALPPCETGLPSAIRNSDGSISPGAAMCCLYKLDDQSQSLVPIVDALGLPFRAEVRNHYMRVANDFVQIWRHKNGTWSNERPDIVAESTATTSTTTGEPEAARSLCQGECLFVAGNNGSGGLIWKPPAGGCANTTTSSTTTTTTTTTTTGTTGTTTTTTLAPDPCETTSCRLRCVAGTTTTAAPGTSTTTSWPPAPSTGLVYEQIGTSCASPCKCFGVGDPCYLLNAEIDSRCVYVTTTTAGPTTTSTTAGPISGPQTCNLAASALGAPAANTYRAATLRGLSSGWIECQTCPAGDFPLFPRGSNDLIDPDPNGPVIVHESPCGRSPCSIGVSAGAERKAVYKAFSVQDQQWYWGNLPSSEDLIQFDSEKFLANWQICQSCPGGYRPANPPSAWLYFDRLRNQSGITQNSTDNTYFYETSCVPGPSCDVCELAHVGNLLAVGTSTTSPPTPRPTTTQAPCGCLPPRYCPATLGECVRTECVPGGGSSSTPVCPTTTTGPNQCWDGRKMCICGSTSTTSTTTSIPVTCSPTSCVYEYTQRHGWSLIQACGTGFCSCAATTTGQPSCGTRITGVCVPPAVGTVYVCNSCLGSCLWFATYGINGTFAWSRDRSNGGCTGVNASSPFSPTNCSPTCWEDWIGSDPADTGGCSCSPPSSPPASICETAETGCRLCVDNDCDCCTTQPCEKYCTFKGNGTGGWTKIDDPCPTTCPCPQYPPSQSASDCDIRQYRCGSVLPTTTTGPSTTTSTTPAPGACCFYGGACESLSFSACRAANGVFQGAGSTCAGVTCSSVTTTQQPDTIGVCCVGPGNIGTGATCLSNASRSYCDYVGGQWHPGPCGNLSPTAACYQAATTTTTAAVGRCCYGVIGEPSAIFCYDNVVASACAPPYRNADFEWWVFTVGATCGPTGSTGCTYPLTTAAPTTTTPPLGP